MSRIELIIKGPAYFSQGDEKSFFDWLQSIPCVESVRGQQRGLHVTLKGQPSNLQLRELIALFYRYRISMKPLAALKTKRNAAWFAEDPNTFWHTRVFGRSKIKKAN